MLALLLAAPLALGHTATPLTQWRFHTGDDLAWADPAFDDSQWETVDLTPASGAHDGDVGLSNYVPGWSTRGHAGYAGYAWYRATFSLQSPPVEGLSLLAPADVDDAYSLFENGKNLGSDGDFSQAPPVVYSIQPRVFLLSPAPTITLAFRVWMDAGSVGGDSGGIHIAPEVGSAAAIGLRYRAQWSQTLRGYVVDLVEPILFALLALVALVHARRDRALVWLALALVATALLRVNQVVFYWAQVESVGVLSVVDNGVLVPLGPCLWVMAWRDWLGLKWPHAAVVAVLAALSMASGLRWPALTMPLRVLLIALFVCLAAHAVRRNRPALPAILLIATGLFARELSAAHLPSVWFPFGVGVSRTQFAYAAFAPALLALLIARRRASQASDTELKN